jgi:hypothetical protein
MRAIKIDVEKKEVYEVDLNGTSERAICKSIYEHLDVECFCQALRLPANDILVVDDNGLIRNPETVAGFFLIDGQPQVLVGHGVIYGVGAAGETRDAQSKLDFIKKHVEFLPHPYK